MAAHKARGLAPDTALQLNVEFGGTSVFQDLLAFMESGQSFDAIFAASDVLAMTAIMALRAKGKTVPRDVAVVGYDNIGQAALTTPALTTVDQNIKEGGRLLVDLLLRQLSGEAVNAQLLQTRLIVRGSTVSD